MITNNISPEGKINSTILFLPKEFLVASKNFFLSFVITYFNSKCNAIFISAQNAANEELLRPFSRSFHHYDSIQYEESSGDRLGNDTHPDSVPYVVYDSLPRQRPHDFGLAESPPPAYSENMEDDGYLAPSGNDTQLREIYHYPRGFEGRETGPLIERPKVVMSMTL